MCIGNSPELIAAYHVLHRLSVPRHPPNALIVLDLTFVSETAIRIAVPARSVQGTTPTTTTASYPFLLLRLGDGTRNNLDFKDLILPINDVKERYCTALAVPCSMPCTRVHV